MWKRYNFCYRKLYFWFKLFIKIGSINIIDFYSSLSYWPFGSSHYPLLWSFHTGLVFLRPVIMIPWNHWNKELFCAFLISSVLDTRDGGTNELGAMAVLIFLSLWKYCSGSMDFPMFLMVVTVESLLSPTLMESVENLLMSFLCISVLSPLWKIGTCSTLVRSSLEVKIRN